MNVKSYSFVCLLSLLYQNYIKLKAIIYIHPHKQSALLVTLLINCGRIPVICLFFLNPCLVQLSLKHDLEWMCLAPETLTCSHGNSKNQNNDFYITSNPQNQSNIVISGNAFRAFKIVMFDEGNPALRTSALLTLWLWVQLMTYHVSLISNMSGMLTQNVFHCQGGNVWNTKDEDHQKQNEFLMCAAQKQL